MPTVATLCILKKTLMSGTERLLNGFKIPKLNKAPLWFGFFLSYSWRKQDFSVGIVPDIFQQKLSLLVIRPNEWPSIITLRRSQQESHSLDSVTKGEAWLEELQQSETQKKSNCFGIMTTIFQCITLVVRERSIAYLKPV